MDEKRDVSKLPRWAAQHIDKLEKDVAYWKELATAGPDNSDTFVSWPMDHPKPLGAGYNIRFVTGPSHGDYIEVRNQQDGSVEVRTAWNAMVVEPKASNTIVVRSADK
jgi:hypothetical protein